MEKTDYIFGMNYISQLQEGRVRRHYLGVEEMFSSKPTKPIDCAFIWSDTRQGHIVWAKRERIFDLYYNLEIMNEIELPKSEVSLEDEPLLIGVDRPLPY